MIPPQVLLTYPFLRTLSTRSRSLIEAQSTLRTYHRGAPLISKGDAVGGMYFVVAGVLRVFTISSAGVEASLYRVKSGESCLLAVNAIFTEIRYPAWVVVETSEVRLFTIPAATFRDLYEQEAEIRSFTLNILSERIFDLMSSLEEISLNSLENRLKSFLLRRADARLEIETTHEEIATYLATAREVVSRKLRSLRKAGLIRTQRGRIKLLKPQALI